jgi:hypothetical protein
LSWWVSISLANFPSIKDRRGISQPHFNSTHFLSDRKRYAPFFGVSFVVTLRKEDGMNLVTWAEAVAWICTRNSEDMAALAEIAPNSQLGVVMRSYRAGVKFHVRCRLEGEDQLTLACRIFCTSVSETTA